MNSFKRLSLFIKVIKKSRTCFVLLGFSIALIACNDNNNNKEDIKPFLIIENGHIAVDAILYDEDGSHNNTTQYGSGTISFNYKGDIEGNFSASGALDSTQTENEGVLAILNVLKDATDETINESLSLLGYYPKGDGKVNVLLLSQKNDWPLLSIEPGVSYIIGTGAPFNCAFLIGLDIAEFWAGEKNFIEIADTAFVISTGLLNITSRDSTYFSGSFLGTTDSGQNALSKHYLLK